MRPRPAALAACVFACLVAAAAADIARPPLGPVLPTRLYLQTGEVNADLPRANLGELVTLVRAAKQHGDRYVLQLDGPMTPARRAALLDAGIAPGDYVPMNAFVALLDAADPAKAAALDFVRWHAPWSPDWKLSPDLARRPYDSQARRDLLARGADAVLVTLFAGATADETAAAHNAILIAAPGPANQVHWTAPIAGCPTISATVALADLPRLADLPQVQFIEPAPDPTPRNDTNRWIVQSNIANVTPLYDNALHGENQILGLIDTRLDRNHCSFSDSNPIGPLHRKILAYNTSAGSSFHGTHVAGTAVGDAGNNTATRGIAYLGKLVYNTIPSFTEADILSRLNTHHNQGARVHTNSWGDDGTTQYNALCRGFDAFQRTQEHSFVCLAVTNTSTLKNPENAKNLLAVGASQDSPNQANHCSGGVGPTSDGRRKPEVYAPGCNTNSANSGSACGLTSATGTSMACPAVAGTAMLVRQYFIDGYYPSGAPNPSDALTPSGALIKAVLVNSAVDMTGISGYPSTLEGWGRVLAANSLAFPGSARRLGAIDVPNAPGLSTGAVVDLPLIVLSSAQTLRVTLVWTDAPATAGAAFASVNNLDLEVIAPANTYRGNVFAAGISAPGGTPDDRNNVEQVHLPAPAPGLYTLRVRAPAVNQETQGYALVITGDIIPPGTGVIITPDPLPPAVIAPGDPTPLTVRINPGADTLVPGSTLLHYRFDAGPFAALPLVPLAGDLYSVTLPPAACAAFPQFYFAAEGVTTGLVTSPDDGPASPFAPLVGVPLVVADDAFESDSGWSAGAPGDTATAGFWVRAAPNPNTGSPAADHSPPPGALCWLTGQESPFGGGAVNDVDGGQTSLLSPIFDLSAARAATFSFWLWFSNNSGPNPAQDIFRVEFSPDGGASWQLALAVGPSGPESSGGWFPHQFQAPALSALARVRFVADDAAPDSTVEAALDDFRIDAIVCPLPPPCPCDWDASGALNSQDFFAFLADFFQGSADFNASGTTDSQDFFDFLACFFAGCP